MKWPRRKPPAPRADLVQIAVLECELFGIKPKPGTAAALAVELGAFSKCGRATTEEQLPE